MGRLSHAKKLSCKKNLKLRDNNKHLQLELLPLEIVLQAQGGGLGEGGDGGKDGDEDEESHPCSDVVYWGLSRADSA